MLTFHSCITLTHIFLAVHHRKKLRAIRQHVNPLSSLYQRPVDLPEGWVKAAFANPSLPFHIDIGSARGRFCVDMAREYTGTNFLGLEIRRPCVEEAFKKMEKYGIKDNVHFVALNANVDIDRVVKDVQENSEIVRCEYLLMKEGRGRRKGREGGKGGG
jgi:tRNA (guanine-N7-)-methyltransferase